MRLLVLNTNTSESITEMVMHAARPLAAPSTRLIAATARFGPRYISSRAGYAIASHAALDAYAAFGRDIDAVLLACFGDPGLEALREVATVPVIGMADAGCHAAAAQGRFAVVTGGMRWISMLTEFIAQIGLSERLAGVHAVAPTGAEIAANPQGSIALLVEACRQAKRRLRADVVVLGGAGLASIAPRVIEALDFPVIDGLAAAVGAAEAAVRGHALANDRLTERLPTVGLSSELEAMLGSPPASMR